MLRYPCPVDITYDQGGEFLGHEYKHILIENECGITTKPYLPRNLQAKTIIERIQPVLGNLVLTYIPTGSIHG